MYRINLARKTLWLLISSAALGCLLMPQLATAAIKYSFIDGAAGDQNGHTLSGFVVFDSACGTACTAGNVTDFSVKVSGQLNYSFAYTAPNNVVVVNGMQHINVKPTAIDLDSSVLGQFVLGTSGPEGPFVEWTGGVNNFYYSLAPDNSSAWFVNSHSATIANAVPEPATWLLMTLGLAMTFAFTTRVVHPERLGWAKEHNMPRLRLRR